MAINGLSLMVTMPIFFNQNGISLISRPRTLRLWANWYSLKALPKIPRYHFVLIVGFQWDITRITMMPGCATLNLVVYMFVRNFKDGTTNVFDRRFNGTNHSDRRFQTEESRIGCLRD